MREKLVVGNWKMNLDSAEAGALAAGVVSQTSPIAAASRIGVGVCPAFVHLTAVAGALAGSSVILGAQNVYHEPRGAFTGEVSAAMLRDAGCRMVLIGHSERRHVIGTGESDWMLNRKVRAAAAAGLTPVLCVGETLAERDSGQTLDVLSFQIAAATIGLRIAAANDLVVAYEPVWAIGTGRNATPDQAQEAHAHLRARLRAIFGPIADQLGILYGGSVTPQNAASLFGQPDVDGGLIGGASLKADSFAAIVAAAAAASK